MALRCLQETNLGTQSIQLILGVFPIRTRSEYLKIGRVQHDNSTQEASGESADAMEHRWKEEERCHSIG